MGRGTADHSSWGILIVGGGIIGCGIARDTVGHGFSVCLAEMSDLVSGTSPESTPTASCLQSSKSPA
ncbi:MAG: FAD-dependent oxidoreductase [Burkholderiaceae bacterium]|nr:FAD-dependent oxidoreductase [Burkholderiaceae bacterium]